MVICAKLSPPQSELVGNSAVLMISLFWQMLVNRGGLWISRGFWLLSCSLGKHDGSAQCSYLVPVGGEGKLVRFQFTEWFEIVEENIPVA